MKALSQPLFASLRGYDRAQLGPDLFSGVLIALLSIPISMGYAQLAGLPPVYGLYGSLVPILLFAMLSTTREFIFGVDAAPAAMIGAVVTSLGIAPGGAEAMRIVPVLTLYVALWLAVFALVRADKAVDYISEPVMGGFISGVCCEIILMQVPKLLGSGTGTGELFELLGHIFDAAKVINWPTAALGFATLAILLIAPRKWPKVPWVLVMMVLGGLLGAFAPLADWGVALLAAVPRGLPKVVLPDLTTLPFTQALVATLPVAAVILAETLLASSGTAQKNGYRLNGRREIAAYAVGNVAAGLVGCCVVSGSVSRTAVNERNGGRTQLVSVMASVTMLVVLLVATPLIRFLPVPVLTAIVVNALIGATEFGIARRLWRVNRVELGIFAGAFLGVLLLGAIKGVLVGMVLSFIDVLMRAAAPQRTFLGTLPGKAGFFPIDRVSGVQALPHIVLYRFSGSLFFANIRRFQEDIEGAVQPDTQAVIVDGSAIVSVDITACDRLVALNRKLRAQGVRFYLTEHIGEVNDQLRHFEAGELIESGAVRRTMSPSAAPCSSTSSTRTSTSAASTPTRCCCIWRATRTSWLRCSATPRTMCSPTSRSSATVSSTASSRTIPSLLRTCASGATTSTTTSAQTTRRARRASRPAARSCTHASSASARSETSAAPSTPPNIRSGTSSTPPSSSCVMSSSSRCACAVRRRCRSRANSARRRSWPARRSTRPKRPSATRSTRPSARRSRPIIWPKRRSVMPSVRLHTAAATTRTERGRRYKIQYEAEGTAAPSAFCCVQAVPSVVRRPKRRFSCHAARSGAGTVAVT